MAVGHIARAFDGHGIARVLECDDGAVLTNTSRLVIPWHGSHWTGETRRPSTAWRKPSGDVRSRAAIELRDREGMGGILRPLRRARRRQDSPVPRRGNPPPLPVARGVAR